MHRLIVIATVLGCLATCSFTAFGPVLVSDQQFAFRDAGHYYYPLHERVQREWNAGRWPLWEPEENAGIPLLGNPTAAVLYPGKLVFALLPYPWAARLYVVGHTLLAFIAMFALMRSWACSWASSGLSALSYAFSGPLLFQSSNVIYLVGAAWLPFGLRAVDRWARSHKKIAILELAFVLAMQFLGGDPQSAYLLGWASLGYAYILRVRRTGQDSEHSPGRLRLSKRLVLTIIAVIFVGLATIALGIYLPKMRAQAQTTQPFAWSSQLPAGVAGVWALAALSAFVYWCRQPVKSRLGFTCLGLIAAALLAALMTAAQLWPVAEFNQQSIRASSMGPHDLYPFSLDPVRMVGMALPNVFGIPFGNNSSWRDALATPRIASQEWIYSVYIGGFTLLLGVGMVSLTRGSPYQIWLSAIVVISLLASLGPCTSPIWLIRVLAQVTEWRPLETVIAYLGPLDPPSTPPLRRDGYLRDGDGGVYWWLSVLLPGFRQFRYPAKLFTFTILGLAGLAGLGWDNLGRGASRRVAVMLVAFLCLVNTVFWLTLLNRARGYDLLRSVATSAFFGPCNAPAAGAAFLFALGQAACVAALALVAIRVRPRRIRTAQILLLVFTTADLAIANSAFVVTVPQSVFETKPESMLAIENDSRARGSTNPFRIYRMATWQPKIWQASRSNDRPGEIVAWERDTLEPKHGINLGLEYTHSFGVGGVFDYEWFFGDTPMAVDSPESAAALGVKLGQSIVYYPRRSFDLWNTRYFIVPVDPRGWTEEYRGFASFLFRTETIYPTPSVLEATRDQNRRESWKNRKDFQILRNLDEFPRAWVVHRARAVDPATTPTSKIPALTMQELLYADDPLWHISNRPVLDPRTLAWIEHDRESALKPFLSGQLPLAAETVSVRYPSPQRTELDVTLETPGLVILSDLFYPGWELTIDGTPSAIYRVNRMMRGAAVPAGKHRLIYRYNPLSFRAGSIISIGGIMLFVTLTLLAVRARVRRPATP